MRVTKRDAPATSQTRAARSQPKPSVVLQVGLLILACAFGFVVHQQGWHRPLVGFALSLVQRPSFTVTALLHRGDLPTLQVDMPFEGYQHLLDKRSQALRLGVNVASAQDYVAADVGHADTTVAAQMRLLEGPAEALRGDAWPLEVTLQDGESLFDLRRFVLVPADDTALSSWAYLETLRQAGLVSPRYYFVYLILNGSPKGVYTLEEQPTAESLVSQGRSDGVVASFDRSAYWEAYARLRDALPGSGFQYAQIAADCPAVHQEEGVALSGSNSSTVCDDAVRSLRALQAGERVPSDVLDADKVGTFLALTTLWRGASELDWRTVRLAYDGATGRFEPIGTGHALTTVAALPESFTDDPGVQVAHARALARFSHPDYLARLQADLEEDLEALRLALGAELGYLESPWSALESHQAVMRHQIAPSRTLSAYVEADDTALVLRLGNVVPFPVEVVSLDLGESAVVAVEPAWVEESDRALLVDVLDAVVLRASIASTPQYVRLRVPLEALPGVRVWDWQSPDQIRVLTRVSGLDTGDIAVPARSPDAAPLYPIEEEYP